MATIYHQVWINAPVAKVYELISTAEGISRWWDKQTATRTDDGLIFEHDPGPEHGVVKLKVLEMVPNKRVEWECISIHGKTTPAFAWTGTHFTFELTEREKFAPANVSWATAVPALAILDFRHSGWAESSEYFGFCNYAWATVLQQLAQLCESEE